MTPQEIQRTMDFILRSEANAIVRMEQWEEKNERWQEQIEEKIDRAVSAVQEGAKLSRDAMRESRRAASATRQQARKIKTLEKSTRFVKRRSDDMKQLMKMAMRLLAHESERLDALERRER